MISNHKGLSKSNSRRVWRNNNTKPPEFDIIHKWNLSTSQQESLSVYKLESITATDLRLGLDKGLGMLEFMHTKFIPIYNNCSRSVIKQDSEFDQSIIDIRNAKVSSALDLYLERRYWLSYRLTKDGLAIVIVQRYQLRQPI